MSGNVSDGHFEFTVKTCNKCAKKYMYICMEN